MCIRDRFESCRALEPWPIGTGARLRSERLQVRVLLRVRPRRPVAKSPPSQGGEPGSIPGGVTESPHGLTARTSAFHADDSGSNPDADATPPASGSRPGLRIQAQVFESPRGLPASG